MNPSAFITDYFVAEKYEALLFIGVGIAAIVLSLLLYRWRSALRGMAGPLVAIALIQLVVGGTVYLRSDEQMATLLQQQKSQSESFKAAETQRMKVVIANFVLYRNIEIGLLALGMAIVVVLRRREYWFAFGLGLVLQSAFMLLLDHFAEQRAHDYFRAVLAS
jgi:hypothetical protein